MKFNEEIFINRDVNNLIDFLYEKSYGVDRSVVIDNEGYGKLFKELNKIFGKDNLSDEFMYYMKNYIIGSILDSDGIDLDTMINKLSILENQLVNENHKITSLRVRKHQVMNYGLRKVQEKIAPKQKVIKLK